MNKFYIYPGNYSYLIKEGLLRRGNWQEESNDPNPFMNCNFIWKPTNLSISEYNKLDAIVKARPKNFIQVFNHFENIRGICTKTGLVRSLKKYYQTNVDSRNVGYKAFDSTPTSFLITAGVEDSEYASFIARYKQIAKQTFTKESIPQKHCEGNYWLVKPANLNQGRGIEVFKNLKDINNFLNSRPRDSFWVVQKYVEKPLLYRGRKFDIRVWVVVTAKDEIFLYRKAYIRTSSDDYDLKASKNYVHLTNNCLQQHGENYGMHEDGNTLPLDSLDELFKEAYPGLDVKLSEHIIPRIKDLIIDTFLCSQNLNPLRRKNVFEFFGFDFLIDEDLRTWLIEVNTNPYLGTPNAYIGNLLPKMIDDMLEIAVDPIFPPKNRPRSASRSNDYELIYCEQGSSYHNGPLNVRSPFTKNVYPIQSLVPLDFQKKLAQLTKKHDSAQNYYEYTTVTQEDATNDTKIQEEAAAHTRSASIETKKKTVKVDDQNNIEFIYKQLHLTVAYKNDINANVLTNQITRVLSYIKNWELLRKRDVKTACKALLLIAESAGSALLVEQSVILTIAKLLRSHEVKSEIKFTLIETVNILSKDIYLRKKLICNHLIQNLITLCLSSCEEKEAQDHSKGFLMATLKCLVNLGCIFNRKSYIPGETREGTKLRSFFIAQGGIIALWIISQKSLDNEMREYCTKNFLNHLEFSDWEKQLQVLDLAMHMPNNFLENKDKPEASDNTIGNSEEGIESRENNLKAEIEPIFYKTAEFQVIEKALNLKGDQNTKNLDKIIYFTGEMLRVLPLDKLREEFADHVKNLKEEWERREKREAEERERRQHAEYERLKKEELKKKDLEDQRRVALESFEKRVQNTLKKQQIENERRQKELEELKQKEIEARKKNIEMLMSKKADRERKKSKNHSPKRRSRKSKDTHRLEDSYDKVEVRNLKQYNLKTSYNLTNSSSSPILHHPNFANDISSSSKGLTPFEKVEDDLHPQSKKDLILRPHQNFEKPDSNRSSPSQLQRDHYHYLPANLEDSSRVHDGIQHFASEILKGDRKLDELSQSASEIKDRRGKSNSNCKLPKLQKAGQMSMVQRITQSPYLKASGLKRINSIHMRT